MLWRIVGPCLVALVVLGACQQAGGDASSGPENVPADALFADSFEDAQQGPWLLEGDELGRTTIADGALVIEIDAPNTVQYAALEEPLFDDFAVVVDVTQARGNPESSFGLLVRLQETGSFYRFEITGDGRYMIERRNADGEWTRFQEDWLASEALAQGLGSTNHLEVTAEGAELSFHANDELLQKVEDTSLARGKLALDAGTFGQAGLRVLFDNFVVYEP
jgi:hypothetical protein